MYATYYIRSMKRLFESFLILVMLGLPSPLYAVSIINVVIYGDSLTAGYQLPPENSYAVQMEKKLRWLGYVNVQVIDMCKPAETSAGGLERISSLILKEPHVVVLELGANDILVNGDPGAIYSNLGHIIKRLQEEGAYVVLIGMKAPPNMGAEYAAAVANMYYGLAKNFRVAYYPFALEGIYGRPEYNLADGYHPNGKGLELMVENTYRLVDAGVRWQYEVMRHQDAYKRGLKRETIPSPP